MTARHTALQWSAAVRCASRGPPDATAEFWDLLTEGRDAVSESCPEDRWDIDEFFDPDPDEWAK